MYRPWRIALLSEEPELLRAVQNALNADHYQVVEAASSGPLGGLVQRGMGVLVIDLRLPADQFAKAVAVLQTRRELPVLLLTDGDASVQQQALEQWRSLDHSPAVERVLPRRFDPELLRREIDALLQGGRFLQGSEIIGTSAAIRRLREQILRVAATPVSTVLLFGESGSGKDLVAQALHRHSSRARAPFIPINCAAIPESLLESELFGHERGAFTDAKTQRRGLFEQADGGTVFLDEIGEMSLAAQIRLLRVLEQREVTRVGGSTAIPVDIRVVAATNKDLQDAVSRREFRLDLYHRLKVVDLEIPPLRQRAEDIPLLIDHFVAQFVGGLGTRFPGFTQEALDLLLGYDWPGNVRELRNLIEHLVFLGPRRPVEPHDLMPHLERPPVAERHLPVPTGKTPEQSERELIYFALLDLKREVAEVRRLVEAQAARAATPAPPVYQLQPPVEAEMEPDGQGARAVEPVRSLKELEKEAIQRALARVRGNRRQAAGLLGISARTLYRKIDEYGLRGGPAREAAQ